MTGNYLVVGLGVTGLSVVKFLSRQKIKIVVTDSRLEPPCLEEFKQKFPNIELHLGKIVVPNDISHIILSPGIALTTPEIMHAKNSGISILGDIELFAQVVDKPVLAITGSNGKSTTTALLGEMSKSAGIKAGIGGNFGTPALDLLDPQIELYILELSSFQLETTYSLQPLAATVLNVSPDHMDRYADLEAYRQAKIRIYSNAKYAIFNRDDHLSYVPENSKISSKSFALDMPNEGHYGVVINDGMQWLARGTELLIPVSAMGILGGHNVANALAALAMGEVAGFAQHDMLAAIKQFSGLVHRCERVLLENNIVWVNDSKGTNVGATVAAIQGLVSTINGKWVIVLGGVGKNADFTPLIPHIAKCCKAAILIGVDANKLSDLLSTIVPCYMAKDMVEVVHLAAKLTQPGDGVLLSPACASFDMFDNYMHRGTVFKENVLKIIGSASEYAKAIGI